MKNFLCVFVICLSTSAFASDASILKYMLDSETLQAELKDRDLKNVSFSKENKSTTWTYKARFETVESGLGPNGPDTHPCFTNVNVVSMGGVAGNDLSEPTFSTTCAMNAPRFQ